MWFEWLKRLGFSWNFFCCFLQQDCSSLWMGLKITCWGKLEPSIFLHRYYGSRAQQDCNYVHICFCFENKPFFFSHNCWKYAFLNEFRISCPDCARNAIWLGNCSRGGNEKWGSAVGKKMTSKWSESIKGRADILQQKNWLWSFKSIAKCRLFYGFS